MTNPITATIAHTAPTVDSLRSFTAPRSSLHAAKESTRDGASRARTGDLVAASHALHQRSNGPRERDSQASDRGDLDRRHVAPELLEAVEATHLGREEVKHHVEVVGDDPGRLWDTCGRAWQQARLL